MTLHRTRRDFLAGVGRGVLTAALGAEIAAELQLTTSLADEPDSLHFGALEPLVRLMQETSPDRLLPVIVTKLRAGMGLRQLTAAAALANARTFGGEDYVGYHTLMALSPAFHMAEELPAEFKPLPILKVLLRNSTRIHEKGGRKAEVLKVVRSDGAKHTAKEIRNCVRKEKMDAAESAFASAAQGSAEDAFNVLLESVHDDTEVHRVVLPYRAWDLLDIVGKEHAHTLLRQSLRYCVKAESWTHQSREKHRVLLPRLLEEHRLLNRPADTREVDDAWIEQFAKILFQSDAEQAATAAASALAEGIAPAAIGEAISLAANQLVLRDLGRPPREESPGKPPGSVHGDSIGVHASDSANAWRNMARVANARNSFASIILGAYQVAHDRTARGGDFANWEPLPVKYHSQRVTGTDESSLLRETEEAIRANLQGGACAVVQRYGELGLSPRRMFDLLLKYAVSEDGSLHAEKYYRTVTEEFRDTRPAYRWRHVMALARVTASEYGRPAQGISEARSLLGLT